MAQIFKEHKRFCIGIGVALLSLLFGIYIYALLLPGLWLRDTFLYKQHDDSFAGSDTYADYKMSVHTSEEGSDIYFSVNEVTRHYQVIDHHSDPTVQIFEDDVLVFRGTAYETESIYLLVDENENLLDAIRVTVGEVTPTVEELFPSYSWIYYCSATESYETRGTPAMLILIFFLAAVLFVDIRYPNLFFDLRYRIAVDGGEPSEWYRLAQKIERVILIVAIIACVIASFAVH